MFIMAVASSESMVVLIPEKIIIKLNLASLHRIH